VKRILRNLFSKRKILTLTMSLNIRNITITFTFTEDYYGLGIDFSQGYMQRGKIFCKFASRRVRGLSGLSANER
jgi:hypothetical protein